MSTREYGDYIPYAFADYYNANYVTTTGDSVLVNDAINNYARTRRNVCCYTANTTGVLTLSHFDGVHGTTWISVPIGGRIVNNSTLKVWLFYESSSADSANDIRWNVRVGGVSKVATLTLGAGTAWDSIELDITDMPTTERDTLTIDFKCKGTNTLTIYSCCSYQPEASSRTWPDLSDAGSLLADIDGPDSAAHYEVFYSAIAAVRDRRVVKSNVYAHWYRDFGKQGAAYGADDNDLGEYKLVKRAGVSKMYVHGLFDTDDKINAATYKATLSDTVEGSVTVNYTGAGTDEPQWDTFVFTFAGANITDEVELTLALDSLDNGHGMTMYLPAISTTEEHIDTGASITHTVPDLANVTVGTVEGASEWDNTKTSQTILWEQSGQAIALADYRFGTTATSYDDRLYLNKVARNKDDMGYTSTSIACRMVTYSSKNSKRLLVTMGYVTNDDNIVHTKTIETQLSKSITGGTFTEQGPLTDAVLEFNTANQYNVNSITWVVQIPAADQETPAADLTPGTEPMQVWIFGYTENTDEYIKPVWISVEEIDLNPTEFP